MNHIRKFGCGVMCEKRHTHTPTNHQKNKTTKFTLITHLSKTKQTKTERNRHSGTGYVWEKKKRKTSSSHSIT